MYRSNLGMLLATDLVGMGVPALFFGSVFSHVSQVGGWQFPEVLILVGSVGLLRELAYLTFRDGLGGLGEEIRTGRFDLIVAKPFPPQLFTAFKRLSLTESIGEGIGGVALIVYGALHLGHEITVLNVVGFLVLLTLSFVLYYSVVLLVNTTAFWIVRAEGLNAIVWSFMEMARYPRDILSGIGKLIFTFLIPISIIATVPASLLVGRIDVWLLVLLFGVSLFFLITAHLFWRKGLSHYNSASS